MERRREYVGYGVGAACTVVAAVFLGLRGDLQVISVFLPGVLAGAYLGGARPGLATIALVIPAALFVSTPQWSLEMTSQRDQLGLGAFVMVSLGMVSIIAALHRARQRAETNLHAVLASEARFERLFATSPVAKSLTRISDRTVVEANDEYLHTFGVTRDEIIGRVPAEVGIVVSKDSRDAMLEQLRDTGEVRDLEVTMVGRDGGEHAILLSSQLLDIDGEDLEMSLFVDLTTRRRAEERAHESARRLQELASLVDASFWVCEMPSRKMLYVSPGYEKIWRRSCESLIANPRSWLDAVHPADLSRMKACVASRDRNDVDRHEFRIVRPDGDVRWIHASLYMVRDRNDEIVRMVGVAEDVTERMVAVERADESDALLRQLAESLQQVFWMTDPDNKVLYVSSQYEAMWGRSAQALMRDSGEWLSSVHPDDRQRMAAMASRMALGGYSERYRIVRPCGAVRWIHDKAFPIHDGQGTVVRIAGVAEDITEQIQLEDKLRQTQKLESIGLLAGGIAHDFNNLLCVIAANTELLREDLTSGHRSSELVDEIEGSIDRAKALTKQLLVFGRKDVTQREPLDLNATLDEGRQMLRRVIGEEYALSLSLDPDAGRVLGDRNQLTQVLMNLCVNARDAMAGGGTITIETRSHGAKATISVTDTGTGMTPQTVARLYEPFFTTKEVGRGTGLGLPVVHGIVQEMRGTIDVETELGRGSTFTITLPTIQGTPCARPDRRRVEEAKGTERILLVDDDDQLRRATMRALQRRGYSVIEASDGHEALALLGRGETVDLLVTDVVMPVMDGRSLAEQATRQWPALRVLYISGYTDDEVIRRGIEHAKVAFVAKPFGPSVLAARVRQLLDDPATASQPAG